MKRIDDRVEVDIAHVEVVGDRRRRVTDRQQAPAGAHLHGDGAGADAVEDLLGEVFGHHSARRGLEHQRCGVGAGQMVAAANSTRKLATEGT